MGVELLRILTEEAALPPLTAASLSRILWITAYGKTAEQIPVHTIEGRDPGASVCRQGRDRLAAGSGALPGDGRDAAGRSGRNKLDIGRAQPDRDRVSCGYINGRLGSEGGKIRSSLKGGPY